MKTRFKRKFDNDSRAYTYDISIDTVLKQIKESQYHTFSDGERILRDTLYVRHWFYCAASSPADALFQWSAEEFEHEIDTAQQGDLFEIWILSEEPKYFTFKCPDEDGLIPVLGAY